MLFRGKLLLHFAGRTGLFLQTWSGICILAVPARAPALSESNDSWESMISKELGSIHNLTEVFMESLSVWHEVGLGSAFGPFDLQHWLQERRDSALPLRCLVSAVSTFYQVTSLAIAAVRHKAGILSSANLNP